MEKYVVLLRGINVGGKNKISMIQLKDLLEQKGCRDVITYINSGNIILSSDITDANQLKEECEAWIADQFQLNIPVFIITVDDLLAAYHHAPSWWGQDKDSTHNAIFIIPPTTVDEVFNEVGAMKPEYEQVDFYGRTVFWSAPVKTYSRTRWSKLVGSPLYNSTTIRNVNTVKKISQLAKEYMEKQ